MADPRPRPRYNASIERAFGATLDSLAASTGRAPSKIQLAVLPLERGLTVRDEIRLANSGDTRALLHEYGHLISFLQPDLIYEFSDSTRTDPFQRRAQERFAEAFADMWEGSPKKDASLLRRIMSFVKKGPDDGQIRELP